MRQTAAIGHDARGRNWGDIDGALVEVRCLLDDQARPDCGGNTDSRPAEPRRPQIVDGPRSSQADGNLGLLWHRWMVFDGSKIAVAARDDPRYDP
jgi:hypothetical protein